MPPSAVTLNGIKMSRTIDNYWLATASSSPGFVFPLPVTITSQLGDTVTGRQLFMLTSSKADWERQQPISRPPLGAADTIPGGLSFPDGVANGSAQFPVSCSYASVQPSGTLPLTGAV